LSPFLFYLKVYEYILFYSVHHLSQSKGQQEQNDGGNAGEADKNHKISMKAVNSYS